MTNLNEKKARREALSGLIRFTAKAIGAYQDNVVTTKKYVYAGFRCDIYSGKVFFSRNGVRFVSYYLANEGRFMVVTEVPNGITPPSFARLPADVRSTHWNLLVACMQLDEYTAEHDKIDAEIAALESEELPTPPATISVCGVDVATELPKTAEDRAIGENIHAAPVVNNIHFEVLSVDAVDESEHDDGTPDEASLTVRATYEDAAGVTVVKDIAEVCGLFFGRKRVSNHRPESLAAKLLDCSEDDARLSSVDLDAVERALQDAFTRSEPALPPLDMSNETNARNVALLSAPVEELEEYCYACTIRKTLAERVRERCQMEAGELPPYTPDSMPVCDRDLIEDINDALDEIDASGVNELLKYADGSENEGRKAKAAGYRAVANLAARYAINDAIEEQPELEELLSELFDWDKPAQLPANIAAGISESFAAARRVFDASCLSPDDLGERSRLWAADTWAITVDYYRGMDDDLVKAFAIHAGAGLWIQYFKQTWMFINDGVVDASCGSFEEQATSFVAILSRYLAPDVEDLY